MKFCLTVLLIGTLAGCTTPYDAAENLTKEEYKHILHTIAPYVIKKKDDVSYDDRFKKEHLSWYINFIEQTNGKLTYAEKKDTATLFFFSHRDHTSLFEHYRGLGGYYKTKGDSVVFLNILYHTPRLTKEEMKERGWELFKEMTTKGTIEKYLGNRKYVQTPNSDFFYNTKTSRWDYTENSSWKFLEEAKQAADSATAN